MGIRGKAHIKYSSTPLYVGNKIMTNIDCILKSRDITLQKGPSSQDYGFSSGHVWM